MTFNGIFSGRETELRITDDKKWVSAFDLIKLVGDQKQPHKTWYDIEIHHPEVYTFCINFKFKGSGQRETPVLNAQGVVMVLQLIPGRIAAQFRMQCGNIIVRYLGGDQTLINEIQTINQYHEDNPNNVASIFRQSDIVQENQQKIKWISQLDINEHNRLLLKYHDNLSVVYQALCGMDVDNLKVMYGCTHGRRFFCTRVNEHEKECPVFLLFDVRAVTNGPAVEKAFYSNPLVKMNKSSMQTRTKNQTEFIEIVDGITKSTLSNLMLESAIRLDMLDEPLPPAYKEIEHPSLAIEQERTKQKEIDLKQMQLQFEMMKYKTEHQIDDLMECDDEEPEVQEPIQDQEMNSESEFKIRIYNPEPIFPVGLSGIRKSEILQKHVKNLCPIGMSPTREQGSDWKCNFPNCNKSDDHFNKMQDHIYNHHLNHRPYKCDKCIQGFIRMIDLVKHSRIH
ncbi:MAG: hypothetical protein PHX34_04500 [Candidatus Shapirobacteria bacterium]|nr:hypothetical protein [Candidatus Shapirobacteria bacterium]